MNLINLREAPIVDKAKEGATLFALNTDGTVERISAENVGGGKVAIIKADLSAMGASTASLMSRMTGNAVAADAGVETLASSGSNEIPCTCDTMTFEEAKAILLAGEKLDAVMVVDMIELGEGMLISAPVMCAAYQEAQETIPKSGQARPEQIMMVANLGSEVEIYWTADGITIPLG